MGLPVKTIHPVWRRKRTRQSVWLFLSVILLPVWVSLWIGASWAQTGSFCVPAGGEAIRTDKLDYAPGENVHISGSGFQSLCDVYVRVTRPDGTVTKGDGTSAPGMDIVATDGSGNLVFTYIRQGNSIGGEHVVDVLDGEINVVAFSIFHNPEPPGPLACPFTVDPSIPADDLGTSTFKTIQSAVTYLPNPGPCTIAVLPGTYDELVNVVSRNSSATDESQRIVLHAPNGPAIVAPTTPNAVGFTLTNSKYVTITGFTVKGSNVHRGFSLSGAAGNSNWDIAVDGNILFDIGTPTAAGSAGISVGSGNPRTWIVNNLIRNNARGGIDLSNGSGPSYIVNNTIHQNGWNGITRASGSGSNAVAFLINNLVVGNGTASDVVWGRWGIYQSGTGSAAMATLRNNMFFNNGVYTTGVLTSGGDISAAGILDTTDADNYTTIGRASTPSSPTTAIVGCTFPDCSPNHAFTDIYANTFDFVLLKTPSQISPAIDKGLNSFFDGGLEWVPAEDPYGGSRVLDGDGDGIAAADIGYHEVPGIDNAPPETIIDSGPSGIVNTNSATFTFHATEPGSTFQCQLGSDAIAACNSRTVTYGGLSDGSHTFSVWATDMAGNADPTPASRTWTIDTVPPDTVIDTTPQALSNSDSAAFTFHATENGSTFECSMDGAVFAACPSPKNYAGLADGNHTFQVRAKDPAGNVDPSPAGFSWAVNNIPDTNITVSPLNPSNSGNAGFYFSGTKAGSTFECSLDSAAYTPCPSPMIYPGLPDGVHTFAVRAVDQAGNKDPSPAAYSWTIDTAPPDTVIDSGPFNPLNLFSATFGFHSTEAVSTYECSLDGAAFSVCSSAKSYPGLAAGPHAFQVRARDQAGNIDPTPAAANFIWSVDTTTLTIVQDVTKPYHVFNQVLYLTATVSSSMGMVNEGNVIFTVKDASSTIVGPITSPPVSGSSVTTYSILPAGTPAGIYTIEARYGGGPNFQPSTGTGVLTVYKPSATISLSNLTQNYDGAPKPVTATTNPAGLAVSITYNGSTAPPINPGSYSVVATLVDTNYEATDATGVLNIVGKAIPAISWNNPADIVYAAPLSGIQLNAVADVQGVFTYTPPSGTVLNAGMGQNLRADFAPADTANYIGTFKTVQINVLKANQAISFGPLPDKTFGDPDFTVTASASSGLPVDFTASGNCTIAGGMVHITGAGSCIVTAHQGGDSNYNPSPDASQSFNIVKATATLALINTTQIYDGAPKNVNVVTEPSGLVGVLLTYNGLSTPPVEGAGYAVVASLANANYQASDATGTLVILRAEAGSDQTVAEGTMSVSIGSPASYGGAYLWEQLAGPPVVLSDPSSPTPALSMPSLDGGFGSQVVTFQLTVSSGGLTTSDTANITVVNVNHPPVANAGIDQIVNEDAPVTLSGIHSYDTDGDPVTYQWVQTGGPAVTLAGSDTATAAFTAPMIPGGIGGQAVLTFQLTVSDSAVTDSKTVNVTVEQVNHPPTADAGPDQAMSEGSLVTLNGSGSDPDGDSLTYNWTQIGGPQVALSTSQSAMPSFTAPAVGPGGGTLVFQLVVNDGLAESLPDTVTIAILNVNDPPACALARANAEIHWPKNPGLTLREVREYLKHCHENGEVHWPPNPGLTLREAREFLEHHRANAEILWPPSHKLVPVEIAGVTDPNNDDVRISITGVTQDEPVDGLGDGDTSPDAVIQGEKVLLRAERSGKGNGRVYNINFIAEDVNGGSCTGSVRVDVPHSMKPGAVAIDSGQNYTSTNP